MADGEGDRAAPTLRRIWDAPTRFLKWMLASAVVTGWLVGQNFSVDTAQTHFWVGYTVAALLSARLVWAFVGAPASRLNVMARDVQALPAYVKTLFAPEPSRWAGHTPTGSLWLLLLWATLLFQLGTGAFAYSETAAVGGALSGGVSEAARAVATTLHHLSARVLLVLIVLHLAAIGFYAVWKNENLIGPMVSGWKEVEAPADGATRGPKADA